MSELRETTAMDLLVTKEVAVRLRQHESTLRYWRSIGYGPSSFKLGRRVVYRTSDVNAWVAAQVARAKGAAA